MDDWEERCERAAQDASRTLNRTPEEIIDLLGSVYLYIPWKYVTKQLTLEQKEMFAEAVQDWSRRLHEEDDEAESDHDYLYWWRD